MDNTAHQNLPSNSEGKPLQPIQGPVPTLVSGPARNRLSPRATAGGPQKEIGPNVSAYIERTDEKPEIPPELKDAGVEHVSDEIEVPYEAQKVGLTVSKQSVPAKTEPDGTVSIPLSMQESSSILRVHKDITDAIVWLANWCLRQFKKRTKT